MLLLLLLRLLLLLLLLLFGCGCRLLAVHELDTRIARDRVVEESIDLLLELGLQCLKFLELPSTMPMDAGVSGGNILSKTTHCSSLYTVWPPIS